MKIDFQANIPVFQQIADAIRSSVAAGIYRSGEALPSIRVLAVEALVNPNTVKRAYEQLEREGLVISRPGSGIFVADEGALAAAKSGSERQVSEAFDLAIAAGLAAGLSRRRIDQLYSRAWSSSNGAKP